MVGIGTRADCRALLLALATLLTACAVTPMPPTPTPATSTPAQPAATPQAISGATVRYERIAHDALPSTIDADWVAAWPAIMQSCTALAQRAAWKQTCRDAGAVDAASAAAVRSFVSRNFDVYRLRAQSADSKELRDAGLATGYYEPLLNGSRKATNRYRVPLYRVPSDLVVVDLAAAVPEVAGLRLRGRLHGQRLVPYYTRGEIASSNHLRGQELLWVDDPIEAFFLQVQGSGRVRLDDGSVLRVGYADHNGHPYRSIGRWLVDQGELSLDQASMQGIKAWAALHPQRLNELLAQNPSFVFFRELPIGDVAQGPKGALGVPLTAGVSVAADTRFVPLGAPLLLASSDPVSGAKFVRPMVVQDAGAAIRGPLRFDLFWGFGSEAGDKAGRQRHEVAAWLFTPRGVSPESLLIAP
jgi:peptidoglycan lytic transglycosylase A